MWCCCQATCPFSPSSTWPASHFSDPLFVVPFLPANTPVYFHVITFTCTMDLRKSCGFPHSASTHLGRDKVATNLPFTNLFPIYGLTDVYRRWQVIIWRNYSLVYRCRISFILIQISLRLFHEGQTDNRWWFGAKLATSHYMIQCWVNSLALGLGRCSELKHAIFNFKHTLVIDILDDLQRNYPQVNDKILSDNKSINIDFW